MKALKKIACSVLALAMVVGLTACAPKGFSHKTMQKFCDEQDFELLDDEGDFYEEFVAKTAGQSDDGVYFYGKDKDAQKVYKKIINRFEDFKKYDVTEVTGYAYSDNDGLSIGFVFTFQNEDDAKKFWKEYGKAFAGGGEKGDEKGYSYYISYVESTSTRASLAGVYLNGNTVLIIRCLSEDTDLTEDLCEAYGVISPTEA